MAYYMRHDLCQGSSAPVKRTPSMRKFLGHALCCQRRRDDIKQGGEEMRSRMQSDDRGVAHAHTNLPLQPAYRTSTVT